MTGKKVVDRDQFFQLSECKYSLRGHSSETVKTVSQA